MEKRKQKDRRKLEKKKIEIISRNKKREKSGLYHEAFKYLKESRKYIYFSILIFFIFALIGFFLPVPEELDKILKNFLKELALETQGMGALELTIYIFWNNIKSAFFGMIFGVFLGIFPFITASLNGYVVGYVSALVSDQASILELWRLLPHGIFELPAIFISLGLGLRLGLFIFNEDKLESFLYYLINSLIVFLLIVLPLLIIAAIIEGLLISLG